MKYWLAVAFLSALVLGGCIKDVLSTPHCGEVYSARPHETAGVSIDTAAQAHEFLVKLEPGWDSDTYAYRRYKSSTPDDVVYREILLTNNSHIHAYALLNWTSITEDGAIRMRALCM
ncbi:MAG: hypothetical protein KKD39_04445 [Candidatus Altiarchaeota archaeon]|nr:hypothetical protein [Candidatus Altiarchaeota archaeon]